jgi:5-methylcytosine-specific restriction endonuclease McrA
MNSPSLIILLFAFATAFVIKHLRFEAGRKRRRDYYNNVYLKSDSWQRKRYVVLRRDNWRCVYCGARATQVHHKKYAKYQIGREPIKWLVSVCDSCHRSVHR